MTGEAVLWDIREETFAKLVVQGVPIKQARLQASYPKGGRWTMKRLRNEPRIAARIEHLAKASARRAVLSRVDILDGVQEEWRLARLAGQHTAALKAAEMLGSEIHGMFVKKMELGKPGEFENKSEEELREYILSTMKELGMDAKLLEHQPQAQESSPETSA